MSSLWAVLTAILLSTLGMSFSTQPIGTSDVIGDLPITIEDECGACLTINYLNICEFKEQEDEPCHAFNMDEGDEFDWRPEHPHYWDEQDWGWGECSCLCAHEECELGEEEEDLLANAIEGLETVGTLGEATKTLKAINDVAGVWIELNYQRNAIQVLSGGGCRPVPGGQVIEHLPVSEDKIGLWRTAFSVQ